MRKFLSRMLSMMLVLILLLSLLLAPNQQAKAAEDVLYSDLFYVYSSSYLKSVLLTSHSNDVGGLTAGVYNAYCNSPDFVWTAVKDGIMAATDLSEFRKLMSDAYGDTDYNYEASLDQANVLFATQLLNFYDEQGLIERFLDGLSSFAELCELFEDEMVQQELEGIGIVIRLMERAQEAQIWDKYGNISINRIEVEISQDPDLSAMLSHASDAYDLGKAILISMMMENIRLELVDEIITNAPADSAIYEGMTRLKDQLVNGAGSYFYNTYLRAEVVEQITETVKDLPVKAGISFVSCYSLVTSLVRIAATVIFDVIFDVPGRDDMTTQFILDQYSSDLYRILVNTSIPKFDGQFSYSDVITFESIFAAYIAASNAALEASKPLLVDSNTVEYNRVVSAWKGVGYERFIASSCETLQALPAAERQRKTFDSWIVHTDEIFVAPSNEIEEHCIYIENGVFPGDLNFATDYTLNTDISVAGNVRVSDEAELMIPKERSMYVEGNVEVNGHLIDTSAYYRVYTAVLHLAGTLHVAGTFKVGDYGLLDEASAMELFVAGAYDVSSYSNVAGTVIFNGNTQQSVKGLTAYNVTVNNPAGLQYLSHGNIYGHYALNGHPLERNGYSTYMYETTSFDQSNFEHVTVSGDMTLRTNVKADVVFSKVGEVTMTVAEGSEYTIDGNLTVEGYLIDNSSYYKAFPATLSVAGVLHVTGVFKVGNYGLLDEASTMELFVAGDYDVSSYSNVAGIVIFNGNTQQSVKGLTAHNVTVNNPAGLQYLSHGNIYGHYALNGHPLERNGYSTYMYETTSFDQSNFEHVTVSGSMEMNTDIHADVVLSKNGSITLTVPEENDITIHGSLVVEGYVIDTAYYYKAFPAYLYLNGTLRVTGNFNVGTCAYYFPAGGSVLYVGGDYAVSNYGSTGGTVIFEGTAKQTSSELRCEKLLLHNASAEGVVISSLSCSRLFDHQNNTFAIGNIINCPDFDCDGILDHQDAQPMLKPGCVTENAVILCESGAIRGYYSTFADALQEYDSKVHYLRLSADLVAVAELEQDVYIDLAGFNLSGILYADGRSVHLLDSKTDGYTCDTIGYFTCTDEKQNLIQPCRLMQTDVQQFGFVKRYVTLKDERGFSAHRFYLGVTHVTMKPDTDGLGYKALFAGDAMVQTNVEEYGFILSLGSYTPKTFAQPGTFESGKPVTLRIEHYDAEVYGETPLCAQVFITLDGETVCSSTCATTLREVVEYVNTEAQSYTQLQLQALAAMLRRNRVMLGWKVADILAAECA